jgi:hypothetical protein
MSPSTGVAGVLVTTSTARPAGLKPRSAAGLVPAGPGLGVGAAVITGKSPAAFPAPTKVVLTFTSGIGPGMAAAWMAPRRLAAPPGPMSELVALFGFGGGPGGGTPPEPVELAVGAGLEDAEGVGLEDAEGVGLAVGVGDVEGAELPLDVGSVGLGVDVGEADVEGAGLSLVVGAGVDGDGLGVSEGPGLVLAEVGEGEGEEAAALANAGCCELTDSPETRKPPVTRPTTTTRRCATDMWTPHSTTSCTCSPGARPR